MALVVLLRGVNVGGHRTFRPAALANELQHLGAVNIGAAGTFVIGRAVTQAALRAELVRRLPFDTEIMICEGRDVVRLMSHEVFASPPASRDIVGFVSVLSHTPRSSPRLPMTFPPGGPWLLEVFLRQGRFVVGRYRRQMKAIGYLGQIDRMFGAPATTRNWNTMAAIVRAVTGGAGRAAR